MKFYTQYSRPERVLEVHKDEGFVKKTGYMTTKDMVEQFMNAGIRLSEMRGVEYEADEVVPDDAQAINPYMGELDATLLTRSVIRNVNRGLKEAENAKKIAEAGSDKNKELDENIQKVGSV